MSGRGDNNKNGTSGQGASNQSNQGFKKPAQDEKSSHEKEIGGKRSEPQQKTGDQASNRNTSVNRKEE